MKDSRLLLAALAVAGGSMVLVCVVAAWKFTPTKEQRQREAALIKSMTIDATPEATTAALRRMKRGTEASDDEQKERREFILRAQKNGIVRGITRSDIEVTMEAGPAFMATPFPMKMAMCDVAFRFERNLPEDWEGKKNSRDVRIVDSTRKTIGWYSVNGGLEMK